MGKTIILFALFAVIAGGCGQTAKKQTPAVTDSITTDSLATKPTEQFMDVPEMTIVYGYGLDTPGAIEKIEWVKPGTSYWQYYKGEKIIATNSDAVHPLDSFKDMVKISGTQKIKISFPYPPSYYTVRYWNERYIGNRSAYEKDIQTEEFKNDVIVYENYAQTMEIENDTIILPDEKSDQNKGYVFEIHAVWKSLNGIQSKGYVKYSFFVTNNVLTN